MKLLWKLLRRHVSPAQLGGFFAANLLGMLIVLLSFQFYRDVRPLFGREDGFLKSDYLILSKRISATGLWGETSGFSAAEIEDIERQPFCRRVGAFTASQYRVSCSLGLKGDEKSVHVLNRFCLFTNLTTILRKSKTKAARGRT